MLRTVALFTVCLLSITLVSAQGFADFDAGARGVLEEFYISLDGPNWPNKVGWLNRTMSYCDWYGVQCAPDSTSVVGLNLINNGLNGQMKFSIGNLKDLKSISLANNHILGFLPFTISRISGLQYLNLSHNLFDSSIPKEFGVLTQLQTLDISQNMLAEEIPAELSNCHSLNHLDLSKNRLRGKVPASLENLQELQYLNLSYNQFSGWIPGSLGNLTELEVLDLSHNQFDGMINSTLQHIHSLKVLNVAWNQIKVIDDFERFDEIDTCNFTGNPFVCPLSEHAYKCDAYCKRDSLPIPGIAVASVFALILGLAAGIVFVVTVEKERLRQESGIVVEDDDGF